MRFPPSGQKTRTRYSRDLPGRSGRPPGRRSRAVQAPFEPQNLNRYTYVLNSPLSYTDPTGFNYGGDFGFGMWVPGGFDLDDDGASRRHARAVLDRMERQFER